MDIWGCRSWADGAWLVLVCCLLHRSRQCLVEFALFLRHDLLGCRHRSVSWYPFCGERSWTWLGIIVTGICVYLHFHMSLVMLCLFCSQPKSPRLNFEVQHGLVAEEALLAGLLRTGTDAAICTLTNL